MPKPRGFIHRPIVPDDAVFGSAWTLKQKGFKGTVLKPDGDWTALAPTPEKQHRETFDTFACVSFGTLNCLEVLKKRVFGDQPNFSERFVAVGSGTEPGVGNDPKTVAHFIRKNWSVFEHELSLDGITSSEAFYEDFDYDLFALAKKRMQEGHYLFGYEYVSPDPAALREALKLSPIGISNTLIHEPGDWSKGLWYKPEGARDMHWMTLLKIEDDGTYVCLDSYEPFIKRIRSDFRAEVAMRYELNAQEYSLLLKLLDVVKALLLKLKV